MEIVHRKGSNHNNADGKSERPTAQLETEDRDDGITSDSEFCQDVCVGNQYDWKKAQLEDVHLRLVQDLKSASNDKPIEEEGYSTTVKRLIGQWENVVLRDGILYRIFEDTNGTAYQFLVPTDLRRNILETLHSGIGGGHLGTKKMLRKLKDRFYWPGWSQNVEIFCEDCLTCATRTKTAKHLRAHLVSVKTEAFVLRNHKAKIIAKKLVEEFICRFGASYAVHSDQGIDFESNLIKEISILFESKKQRTTAYHPQSDGQVKRFNETLLNMLKSEIEVRIEGNREKRNNRFKSKTQNKQLVLEKGHNPHREQQFATPDKSRRENTGTNDAESEDEEQNSVPEFSIAEDGDTVDERVDSDSENIN
ncbi:unnamed protein product [Mytilus coruscus]|uniref:Integrase catalytic domain-containing protein n=1 Tax=Mytilus coruscus TaxID=42192 RepID=A0A6J7ZW40_MYTCO|nr:unnamed protein product [Mytilus coruscus]